MSLITFSPQEYERNVTRQEAESQLLEMASWLASRDSKIDRKKRWERIVLFATWFPKLGPLCRQIARGGAMHPSSMIRREAADALGWIGNRSDYHCLIKLIADDNKMVRWEAVESLFVVGERLALPHYKRILTGDFDEGMQRAALHGLDALDDTGGHNGLVMLALENPKLSALGRGTAIDYQFQWYGNYLVEPWIDLLKHDHFLAYMRPIWTLTASPELFDTLPPATQTYVLAALSEFAERSEADEEYPRWQPKAARELIETLSTDR
jgi:hypothetical protein